MKKSINILISKGNITLLHKLTPFAVAHLIIAWNTRGVQKQLNFKTALAQKLIPFLWGILRSTNNFNFLGGREVLPLDSQNIQRKF